MARGDDARNPLEEALRHAELAAFHRDYATNLIAKGEALIVDGWSLVIEGRAYLAQAGGAGGSLAGARPDEMEAIVGGRPFDVTKHRENRIRWANATFGRPKRTSNGNTN